MEKYQRVSGFYFLLISIIILKTVALEGATSSARATNLEPSMDEEASPQLAIAIEQLNRFLNYEYFFENDSTQSPAGPNLLRSQCASWTVHCLGKDVIHDLCQDAGAFCAPAGVPDPDNPQGPPSIPPCSIVLTPQMCRAIGMDPSQTRTKDFTLEELLRLLDILLKYDKKVNAVLKIWGACVAAEEIGHAIDLYNGVYPFCKTERDRDIQSVKCYEMYRDNYCKGRPDSPRLSDNDCERLTLILESEKMQRDLNADICSRYDSGAPIDCDSVEQDCSDRCKANPDQDSRLYCEEHCKELRGLYCNGHPNSPPPSPAPGPR